MSSRERSRRRQEYFPLPSPTDLEAFRNLAKGTDSQNPVHEYLQYVEANPSRRRDEAWEGLGRELYLAFSRAGHRPQQIDFLYESKLDHS